MFCPICTTPHNDSCISDNVVQASMCHCARSPFQQSKINYAVSCCSYDLLNVPHMVHIQTALYFFMVPNVKCSMRFYTIMLEIEMSVHQELVTTCKLAFLKCLNTESSINGFPPCQKIKNASLSDPKEFTQFYQYGLCISLGISWCYSKHWHFILGLEW